jgi:hypothetical protein
MGVWVYVLMAWHGCMGVCAGMGVWVYVLMGNGMGVYGNGMAWVHVLMAWVHVVMGMGVMAWVYGCMC